MTAVIRDASPADLPALVALDRVASSSPWSPGQFAESLASHRVLVLEVKGDIVWFMVFSLVLDEAELFSVAVDPSRQGQGYGTALVKRLVDDNRGHASRIFLEVRVSNLRAIELYRRLGFTQQGVRKGYYPASPATAPSQGREDAWIMVYEY
jgi:[ribosomal protein S18]-alanine N-acetyltransferase